MSNKKLIPRDGVVMSFICGNSFLIPTRKAFEEGKCDIMPISFAQAALWLTIYKHKPVETAYKLLSTLQHKSIEEVKDIVDDMLEYFIKKGVLIEKEQPNTDIVQ